MDRTQKQSWAPYASHSLGPLEIYCNSREAKTFFSITHVVAKRETFFIGPFLCHVVPGRWNMVEVWQCCAEGMMELLLVCCRPVFDWC